jgi:hypothetical protein
VFRVKDLFDAAPLEVRMMAQNVNEIPARDAKQYRCPIHVNGDDIVGPGRKRYHPNHPFTACQTSQQAPRAAPRTAIFRQ